MDLDLIFNEETSNTQNVSITILNDICLEEDDEDFSVVVTSGMDCVEIVGGSVSIAIRDDDSEFFCYHNFLLIASCSYFQGQR